MMSTSLGVVKPFWFTSDGSSELKYLMSPAKSTRGSSDSAWSLRWQWPFGCLNSDPCLRP